ncbi:hypothetical protein QBC47DRAFT_444924 [Echria macrotheca]|uniref:Uncharacterized protein n=1 Tax=Echria macrotheca TaxID=438768 RepID=A0AAJ0BFR6_9PEZI|nr:hypothetical protein QBC47DRAFT_444924 [Echria macrotheca]
MIPSLTLMAGILAGLAMATPVERRGLQVCYAGEAQDLFCYKKPQGTPQDVRIADILYAARELRAYGTGLKQVLDASGNPVFDENGIPFEEPDYRFLNMTTTTAGDCGEWTIFSKSETVLVAAKLMTAKMNGIVWYGDIADTIDGGENATDDQKKAAIISCGTDGGSREVKGNTTLPAYAELNKQGVLKENYTAGQIVIKVVQNLDWKAANPGWENDN